MSASKPKFQKDKSKSEATPATNHLDDNEEFPSVPNDMKKKTETSDQKLKDRAKGLVEDVSSDNEEHQDTEQKILGNGTNGKLHKNKLLAHDYYVALKNWWNQILPNSKFGHQNGIVSDGTESPKNLFQKLEPYQHKINSVQNAVVVRTKFLILAIFWLHFLAWVILSVLLGIINLLTFLAGPWSLFPIIGWSLILLGHFIITHRLLKGAGQNDLEWADAKLWEYIDRAKEISYPTYSTYKAKSQDAYTTYKAKSQAAISICRAKSQVLIVQIRTKLSNGYTYVNTHVQPHFPESLRQKSA